MKNRELISMFKYSSMIKAMAFTAACFAFLAVLFKNSIVLVPEATEVRLCNVLACSFGIWFGPAGAIGCAIGNLMGDFGGSLTVLSYYGFLGNFFSAWVPYKVWCVTGRLLEEDPYTAPTIKSKHWALRYLLGGFGSVVTCSAILAYAFDVHGFTPASNTFRMIFLNNTGATLLGFFLFMLGFVLLPRTNFYWRRQMMEEREFVFSKAYRIPLLILLGLSLALTVGVFAYVLYNGFNLQVMDEFNNKWMIYTCAAYTVLQVLLVASCGWRQKKVETNVVSLD